MPVKCSVYALTYFQQRFLMEAYKKPGQKASCTNLTGLFTIPRARSLETYGYVKFVEEKKQTKKHKGKTFDRTVQVFKLTVAGRNQIERAWPSIKAEQQRKKDACKPKPTTEQLRASQDRAIEYAKKSGDQVWDNARKRSLPKCPACGRYGDKRRASHCSDTYTHRGYVTELFKGFAINNVVDSCTVLHEGYSESELQTRFPALIKIGVRMYDLRYGSYQAVERLYFNWKAKHLRARKETVSKAIDELIDFAVFVQDGREIKPSERKGK